MVDEHLFAVVMAGGSGTRFWPASTRSRPKQFLAVAGERPMITETVARLEGLVAPEHTLVVAGAEQAGLVRECLPDLDPANVLLEPVGRNTAACVALAAFEVERRDPAAAQVVLPADHVIRPAASFQRTITAAVAEARRDGRLVTLGIVPDHAATGYGYIEQGERLAEHDGIVAHEVLGFVEKPDAERAAAFLASGSYRWNAGIFVWETAAILDAFRRHAPTIHAALDGVTGVEALALAYEDLPALPVDEAIMERAERRSVLGIDYTWSDVGSWPSLADVLAQDADGNHVGGGERLVALDAQGCVVHGDGGLTALIGVSDLVVVRAGKTTLVCPRERAQEVKAIVARLAERDPESL
ncbi:MAG: sugar phosphate nucleotidyltransferase [Planctomycetota bacterium]|jgi:mannose-1-phosphate guanylyltransferase|nr:sugar phosphate nucleotidyltransferase [Planctomycetota bacterium]MDP6763402.1 sugar phosphate nucleotidyltransferase [Planctomycetota bacterium]MDP6988654.1 sugar phosphate nucleotidyltransferase [Planctomycetota bacterium]